MGIDIKGLIRGRREARAANVEELAQRLAGGEDVPPEEIELWLEQTGCSEDLLQERIDAIERRSELLATVAKGKAAAAKIERIEADIGKAEDAVEEARRKQAAVVAKHVDELFELRQASDAAARASAALLEREALSAADWQRLDAARRAATAAAEAAEEGGRNVVALKEFLERSETELSEAQATAKKFRGDPGSAERSQRAKNAVAARGQRLKAAEDELPKLVAEAERTGAALRAIEDELRK